MQWYNSAPITPSSPLSRHKVVSLSFCLSPVELTDRRGGGRGAKSYDRRKAWPSINHLILSAVYLTTLKRHSLHTYFAILASNTSIYSIHFRKSTPCSKRYGESPTPHISVTESRLQNFVYRKLSVILIGCVINSSYL